MEKQLTLNGEPSKVAIEESLVVDSEEQISKELNMIISEQEKAAEEILQRQEDEKIKKVLTNPSAIALTTTAHSSGEGISKFKKSVKQLFILYLTNQFVARAINIRADSIVSKGYDIIGEDKEGVEACKKLLESSGGKNLIWQLAVNAYIAGDAFLEKIYFKSGKGISRLKHIHPLTLEFKKDTKTDKILVDKNKEPIGYVQYFTNAKGVEEEKDVSKDIISHFKFNSLGDEFTGMSAIQPGYNTIVRLMNMEYSAAEAAIKTANPLIVGMCNTKSPHQIAQWGQILGNINGRDQIFVPQDMDIKFLSPGQQNFNDYAEYFLNAVVATFGVPKSVLLGDSTDGSRAEGVVLSRHFYSSVSGDQRSVTDFINYIFEEYGRLAGFKAPEILFGDVAEDASLLAKSAIELYNAQIITLEEAREMVGLEGAEVTKKPQKSLEKEVQDKDMKNWHNEPGNAPGSQAGKKAKQKLDPNSSVSPFTK